MAPAPRPGMKRRTLKTETSVRGVGLHTGRPCRAVFRPAPGPTGLRFLLPDGSSPVPALLDHVSSTVRGTNLSFDGRTVHTVEHILSCCAALGVHEVGLPPPQTGWVASGLACPSYRKLKAQDPVERVGGEVSAHRTREDTPAAGKEIMESERGWSGCDEVRREGAVLIRFNNGGSPRAPTPRTGG